MAGSKLDCILVYTWQAWQHFLISHLVEDDCRVKGRYDDEWPDIAKRLTPNIRAVLFQVNLSYSKFFPARRAQIIAALKRRNIAVLNTEIQDISKRNLHRLLKRAGLRSTMAAETGPADEKVFVKSNLNSGGEIELRMPQELRPQFLPQQPCLIKRWDSYYVAERGDIAAPLWSNDSIVIERYIENAGNGFFRVYGFGDAIIVVEGKSDHVIKKLTGRRCEKNIYFTRSEMLGGKTSLPPDLHQQIKGFMVRYPLAYFCLDIVHDGEAHYIVDLNLTPYSDPRRQTAEAAVFLRRGAESFVKRAARELATRAAA